MATRHLYLARHGAADAFGTLTDTGRQQAQLLGQRLAHLPMDVVWHSPLPRAAASADQIAEHLPGVPVIEAPELVDHVPYVPHGDDTPPSWVGFFDGYTETDAAAGQETATTLVARFGGLAATTTSRAPIDTHELLITHSYPIAWLIRHALDAPRHRWLGLESANAALTLIEHRSGLPATLVLFNDMSHLPADLRWTGFPGTARP
ncbi:histidine phosphatase family protein [Blastococcus brunescens]|uniref:Histidine phosphatase family protein n=1 Tax=Blastococcus brunescens TaxID=1564165 RepID=A0ABZ1B559_9ACTN|nr:histidine phosphatase family protein [Blastococcus sp. BMG 8361]WRL65932.1 histidine phosphatase family protein [Blastococcus sp. BMG 8361]